MLALQLVRIFGGIDRRVITRDRFLLFMFAFTLYIALAFRYFIPWLNGYLAEQGVLPSETIAASLADYYPLLVGFFLVFQGALLAGVIFGFVLLDEKDDQTLKALLVTPIPLPRYLMYRIGISALFGFLMVMFEMLIVNLAMIPMVPLLLIAAGASLTAPIVALFFAVTAQNKIQGFAMGKFVGLAGYLIVFAWFVDEPLQWLFGLFPPYWINKAYWMVLEGNEAWWGALVLGVVLQGLTIAILVKLFTREAHR